MTFALAAGYCADVDAFTPTEWYDHVSDFHDASLYQLWYSPAAHGRYVGVSRLLLRRDGDVVAAAETRLVQVPLLGCGFAYVFWGPLYRLKGRRDVEAFRQAVHALRNEYALRRGLILRLRPRLSPDFHAEELQALSDEGFARLDSGSSRTLLVDLSRDVGQLRQDFDKKWRNCLNKAERAGLNVSSSTDIRDFDLFATLYERMLQRKQFVPTADLRKHRRIQQELPESLRMRVVLANLNDEPCAGAIYSAIGDTGIYLFGATGEVGMRSSAAYLVQWEILKALKAQGLAFYDLNGIDPVKNPGTFHFKRGLAGRAAVEVAFAGQYQAARRSMTNGTLLLAERMRTQSRTNAKGAGPNANGNTKSVPFEPRLSESLASTIAWVQDQHYRGYEPADGNSSLLFPLTGGRVLPMRVLQQAVLRAPFNIRPLLGVRPHESAIARGYMAWGYTLMCRSGAPASIRAEAQACFEWLIANRAPGYSEYCWGDPYHYATRSGRRPFGEPLLIWTALIGQAFLDAFETFADTRYRGVAESIGAWVLTLPYEETDSGVCLSYVPYRQSSIHNSNAMGAAFLARLGALTGDYHMLDVARRAMSYTCSRQRADGAWFYAEDAKYRWVDSFHTGYNLSALKTYQSSSGDRSFERQRSLGLRHFRTHFFADNGRPSYFDDGTGPVDIQCAAQGIETLAALSDEDPECLDLALKLAAWTIDHMQEADGHFCYRDLGWTKVRTPMLHWGQATMVKALATVLAKISGAHAALPDTAVRTDYARA